MHRASRSRARIVAAPIKGRGRRPSRPTTAAGLVVGALAICAAAIGLTIAACTPAPSDGNASAPEGGGANGVDGVDTDAIAASETAEGPRPGEQLRPASQPALRPYEAHVVEPTTVEEYLDLLETEGLFNGVVIVQDGDTVTRRGFGYADREALIPIDTETVFDIGSISKQFTGAGIVRLEMDGRLSFDDPISEFLPGLPVDKADITIHQLLTHTAGFGDGLGDDYDPTGRDDYLRLAAGSSLLFEPGTRFSYSNPGYSLLAMIIEEASGVSYEQYLRQALFEPARMLDTGYVLPDWSDDVIAVGYPDRGGNAGRPNDLLWDADGPYWHLKGNGGLLASSEDMLRWHQALVGDKILDEEAKELYFGRHASEGQGAGSFYGYGWANFPSPTGGRLITHNGGNGIFFADFLRFVDDDVTIYTVTNSARFDFDEVAYTLAGLIFETDIATHVTLKNESDETPCGFADLNLSTIDDLPVVDELQATAAGRTVEAWLNLLADGDEPQRRTFAEQHLAPLLVGNASPDDADETIASLQAQIDGARAGRIYSSDTTAFHVVFDDPSGQLVMSVGVQGSDPTRIHCLHLAPLPGTDRTTR